MTMLGALTTMDIPIVKSLHELGYEISWFGINVDECDDFKGPKISLSYSKAQELFERIKSKIIRILRLQTGEEQKLIAQKRFDKWMARNLEKRRDEIDSNLVFIGRAVSSELSFKVIKKYGGRCIIHSQWTHPIKHINILENAFDKLGNSYVPVPKSRLDTQLKEIELCDKVWCTSEFILNSYLENGVPRGKLFLSPLGVDIDHFKPNKIQHTDKESEFIIVFVGNINIEKGINVLLEAILLADIPGCKVILNGAVADYFQSTLDDLVTSLRESGVEVFIGSGAPLKNFQKADLFVLPAYHESFGLVVLEAMACGLPVIISDRVGALDHVIHGVNGFIIPVDSPEALKEKIQFINLNRDQSSKFGEKSRNISESLSWPTVAHRLANEIEK